MAFRPVVFPIQRAARARYNFDAPSFSEIELARELAARLNATRDLTSAPERAVKSGRLCAAALLDEIFAHAIALYCDEVEADALEKAPSYLEENLGAPEVSALLTELRAQFGAPASRPESIETLLRLRLANLNPALQTFAELFDDSILPAPSQAFETLNDYFAALPGFGPDELPLLQFLLAPIAAHPDSVEDQLRFILARWGRVIEVFAARILTQLDVIREEEKPTFFGPGPIRVADYRASVGMDDYEAFSPDRDWMPRVVLLAKSTYVWLDQLSKKYEKHIYRLDQVPDEELDEMAARGFTGLWLIGLWQRSKASQKIKQMTGNPDALASAYSLFSYDVAGEIGGQEALDNLRHRAGERGIRMASDMVPNHMAIDSRWVIEHPDWFLSLPHQPFPNGNFDTPDLCDDARVGVYLEAGYYSKADASVVFKRVDHWSGETRYIYHGNDGTSIPWNDTAQLNYLSPEVRHAALQTILHVARQFPIIRFDAAMTLAKRQFHRLWFPAPGAGGDIPSRAGRGLSADEFEAAFPTEFWREVVDTIARELPDTLLLAEAFWMMESYFVRTLGMHRVYNSAFMHMLRDEKNQEYRLTLKNTLEFDPAILGRFVNFMNNPDEETAVEQFGKGDKYFGVCTLLSTLPGLPMFGHGQIEGYAEKYGMEYPRAYWNESVDEPFVEHHRRVIFPLLHRRHLFAGSAQFTLYDFWVDGAVNEDVFAYSNRSGDERALVIYNNCYEKTSGWIKTSVGFVEKDDRGNKEMKQRTLGEALSLTPTDHHWAIFRDNSSDLEFLRSSKEIVEKGLFVELNEYGYQVFWEWREVADESGLYARLSQLLGGAGTKSVARALKEMLLEPIHRPFRALCEAPLWAAVLGVELPSQIGGGIAPDEKSLVKAKPEAAALKADAAALETLEQHWLRWARAAARFVRVETDVAALLIPLRSRLERAIAAKGSNAERAQLLAYALVADIGKLGQSKTPNAQGRAWLDDWLLSDALGETLGELGAPENAARDLELWVAHLAEATPFALLSALLADPRAQEMLAINRFQNTLWFRAEGWEDVRDSLKRGAQFESVELPLEALDEAAQNSGFRVVKWMDAARRPDKKVAELPATTSTAKKKPAQIP